LVAQREHALRERDKDQTPLGSGFLDLFTDPAAVAEAKSKADELRAADLQVTSDGAVGTAATPLGAAVLELLEDHGTTLEAGSSRDAPSWLQRVSAAGRALSDVDTYERHAGVSISPCANAWSMAQCMAIERAVFDASETMDIAAEVRARGTTLLCAVPVDDPACVGYAVVQRVGGALLGGNAFAALQPAAVLVSKLAVARTHRRGGVGRALLAGAISHARTVRATRIYLHVDETNEAARALYASMGLAQRGGQLPDYYGPGRHALEVERIL
jgi:ribosomal protein S18 acetylase RimI-like enzyme